MNFTTEEKELIIEMLNKNAFPGSMAKLVSELLEKMTENLSANKKSP